MAPFNVNFCIVITFDDTIHCKQRNTNANLSEFRESIATNNFLSFKIQCFSYDRLLGIGHANYALIKESHITNSANQMFFFFLLSSPFFESYLAAWVRCLLLGMPSRWATAILFGMCAIISHFTGMFTCQKVEFRRDVHLAMSRLRRIEEGHRTDPVKVSEWIEWHRFNLKVQIENHLFFESRRIFRLLGYCNINQQKMIQNWIYAMA